MTKKATPLSVATRPPKPSHWLRRILYIGFSVVFSILLGIIALVFYIGTESGLRNMTVLIDKVSRGAIHITQVEGRLWQDVAMRGIRIKTHEVEIAIESVQLHWQASQLLTGTLRVKQLAIGATRINTRTASTNPNAVEAPTSLTLPIHIDMPNITLERLAFDDDKAVLTDLAFSLSSDGVKHHLLLRRAATAVGKLKGQAVVAGTAPFATTAQLNLVGEIAENPLVADLQADGSLRQLYVLGSADSALLNADVDTLLDIFAPYKYDILRQGKIEIHHFNPQLFDPRAPQADINLYADIRPAINSLDVASKATGRLYIENTSSAPLDLQGVPIKSLYMQWQLTQQQLHIDTLHMAVGKSGALIGQGVLAPTTFTLDLTAQAIDLHHVFSSQARSSVDGKIGIQGEYGSPLANIHLHDMMQERQLQINTGWRTSAQEHTLLIKQFLLSQRQGKLSATGELDFTAPRSFILHTEMQAFDPAQFGPYPKGNINATVNMQGALSPISLKADYLVHDSQFNAAPLSGKGEIHIHQKRLNNADATLRLGKNLVSVKGQYGAAKDTLVIQLDLANVAQLGPGFAGTVYGQAHVSGDQKNMSLQTRLQADNLMLPGGIAIRSLAIEGNIDPDLQQPFRLNIDGKALQTERLNVATLHLRTTGTRARHTIQLDSQGRWDKQPVLTQTRLTGSLPTMDSWQGHIQALTMGFASGKLSLQSPAKLHVNPTTVQLEHATLAAAHSQIVIQRFAMDKGKIDTQGQIVRLDIADILAWMPQETLQSDVVLQGRWQISAADTVQGKIDLTRQQGDVIWRSAAGAKPIPLKLSQLKITATIEQARANIEANLAMQAGTFKASARTVLSQQNGQWGVYSTSPLDLHVTSHINELDKIGEIIQPGVKLAGQLHADVTRKGTIGRGALAGSIQGHMLAVHDSVRGIHLTDGSINARLTADYLLLERLIFKGGYGTLQAAGKLGLYDRNANIQISADRLTALSRPDLLVILTGQSTMFMKDGELTIAGQAHIDEAKIQLSRADTPHLSDDVIVVGRTKPQPVKTENFTLAALQFEVDLGGKTTFSGKGVDALLGGKLHITAHAQQPIYATGVIRVDKGSYKAYGQNLTIDRGFISFQGPFDNPGLDIIALRKGPAVEAGIKITGTGLKPIVTLVSTPAVPDNEKLSWMMFGKGTDTLNPQDGASVLAAASSLFLTQEGPSLQRRIADTIGLDEIGLASGTTADTAAITYLTLGKRLAENLYLSYEQGLGELDSALKLQYIFSKHWQAVARAGTKETMFDIFYTISFD